MDKTRFATYSLQDRRLLRILAAALEAVDPYRAVQRNLPDVKGRVFGLGIGKAAIPMMDALSERVRLSGGLAVTKYASGLSRTSYTVMEGGHPVPDARSLRAGQRVLEFVSSLEENDTLIFLISGGGSALVTAPYIALQDLQELTSMLLASGARIDEINTLRRELDRIKGGGLALATKAGVISLILSDVIGNPLEVIASGPTVQNPTTRDDALQVLDTYFGGRARQTSRNRDALNSVTQWLRGFKEVDPRKNRNDFNAVRNIIIGDNRRASIAAKEQAEKEGIHSEVLMNDLQGEAREQGIRLAQRLQEEVAKRRRPFCLIAGGETTVTLQGDGKGGRNQELALAAVPGLDGLQNAMLISLATDGDDGPTDAAGAVVTGETAQRAAALGLDATGHLSRNDAYPFFEALGDLIRSGPTRTNVNDLVFLCAL